MSTRILLEVGLERRRQEELRLSGKFQSTCADPLMPMGDKLAVLTEEVGEVAHEINEHPTNRLKLREELIQVAAVAVAWVEAIDATQPSTQTPQPSNP